MREAKLQEIRVKKSQHLSPVDFSPITIRLIFRFLIRLLQGTIDKIDAILSLQNFQLYPKDVNFLHYYEKSSKKPEEFLNLLPSNQTALGLP